MASSKYRTGASSRALSSRGQRLASQIDTAKRSCDVRPSCPAEAAVSGGFDVRMHSAVSALAASLIAFAPFQAFAQDANNQNVSVRDRPRPEYDPLGARVGGFDLNAQLDAGVTYTDNLFALPS